MPELIPLKDFFYKLFELTPRQTEILLFILQFRLEHGWSPSYREIGEKFRIVSTNGVLCNVDALMHKGAVRRGVGKKNERGHGSGFHSRSIVPTMRFIPANPVDAECAIGEKS